MNQHTENSNSGLDESASNKKGSSPPSSPNKEVDRLQQRQNPKSETFVSQSSQEGSAPPVVPEKVSNSLQLRQSPDSGIHASGSNVEGSFLPAIAEKELDNLHQRHSPDRNSSQSNQDGSSLSIIPEKELNNLQQKQSPDTEIHASESNQEGKALSTIPAKLSNNSQQRPGFDNVAPASQLNEEKFAISVRPEKALDKLPLRRNPDIGGHVLHSNQEAKPPPIIPDKPSEDGYNWRKYGQKFVRGNEFIRSYYKCTYPNCPAKKQVERSHDGHITDIKYLRRHEHPKPQRSPQIAASFVPPVLVRKPDATSLIASEDESSNVHSEVSRHIEPTEAPRPSIIVASDVVEVDASQSSRTRDEVDDDDDPDLKRQKRDISNDSETLVNKSNGDPRVVVQTMSEVDIVNDGYRWRKYGQKLVKGNPNPRSYYRCSSAGCPVKKHVERASHDPKVVITTYEGQHDHNMPPGRTVTHNTGGANASSSPNGDSRSEPEEKNAVGLDLVVHVSAN